MLLGDVLAIGARMRPDRTALIAGDGMLTYAELAVRARRLASGLARSWPPGSRIAILARNRQEYVEAYFGVPDAGMILTVVNYRLHPREMAWILGNATPALLLVEDEFLPGIEPLLGELPGGGPDVVRLSATGESQAYEALLDGPPLEAALADEHDVAWIIYTSGTTGRPKGAMLTHRNLLTSVYSWMAVSQPERDGVCLMCFPLCHVSGYVVPRYFLQGSMLILRPSFEPLEFMETVDRFGVTASSLAPTMLEMLLSHPAIGDHDLSSLRTIGYGGSSIAPDLLARAMRRFPAAGFTQGFGMTETAGNIVMMDPAAHRLAATERPDLLAAAGRPMPLVALRIADDAGADVAAGAIGEILVRGDQTTIGYWDNPEATHDALRAGWYRTGDLGRRDDDGYVHVVDRCKDMIVTGGENVYSREVEDVLAAHPAVLEAAVIGIADPQWGEAVCGVVVLRAGQQVGTEALVEHCRAFLAGYKRPRRIAFVAELPRNSGGKVLKGELRTMLAP